VTPNQNHLLFDGFFDIFDVVIKEDQSYCAQFGQGCGDIKYRVSLEVNKGSLRFNPACIQSSVQITSNTGSKLVFTGGKDAVNRALDLFEYRPLCPFDSDNTLTAAITASPNDGSSTQHVYWGQVISVDVGDAIKFNGNAEQIILTK